MARHPASDIRSVVGDYVPPREVERIFVRELAGYLRVKQKAMKEFLKGQGLLRMMRVRGSQLQVKVHAITSARGAALAIAHFRAQQAVQMAKGRGVFSKAPR